MSEKTIHGYIDCPCCGTSGGMRITHDKNGHPFGFCTAECGQQLRVGPSRDRIAHFLRRFPWAGPKPEPVTVPAGATAQAPAAAKPAPVPAPAPARKIAPAAAPRSGMADALAFLGVR